MKRPELVERKLYLVTKVNSRRGEIPVENLEVFYEGKVTPSGSGSITFCRDPQTEAAEMVTLLTEANVDPDARFVVSTVSLMEPRRGRPPLKREEEVG